MRVNSHIVDVCGNFAPHTSYLSKLAKQCLAKISNELDQLCLDVVISNQPNGVIPEIGMMGYTISSNLIMVYLDSGHSNFPDNLETELLFLLAHESHHAARMGKVGYGKTLFESMVSEGAADCFARQICGPNATPWSIGLYKSTPDITKKVRRLFDSTDFSFDDIFFGSEPNNFPRCGGYALGYKIVERYMTDNPSVQPSALVGVSADNFKGYV